MNIVLFEELLGKTFKEVKNIEYNDEDSILFSSDSEKYVLFHNQTCCEDVYIEDINGNLEDLIGSPITLAEESYNYCENNNISEMWTFYKLATIKGYVTIRWYGSSNGCYSEKADLIKL